MISDDIAHEKVEITKMPLFKYLSGNVVMCVFTLGSKFTFKQGHNDYLPEVKSIFKKLNNVWKKVWMQRSIGK